MYDLVFDSGSTKTAWQLIPRLSPIPSPLPGINPVRDDADHIRRALAPLGTLTPRRVFFYGAGCIAPFKTSVEEALRELFPQASVEVESDILGAARALCGEEEGIACILGTGSNSCLFSGKVILAQVSPLGYILGDEGSGAVLGRTLVADLLKGQLPAELRDEFLSAYALTPADIIERVYRQPQPNRFLASLVPFIAQRRERDDLHRLLVSSFRLFFRRNVAAYKRPDLMVHFVGGVAKEFAGELTEAAHNEGFEVGRIKQTIFC